MNQSPYETIFKGLSEGKQIQQLLSDKWCNISTTQACNFIASHGYPGDIRVKPETRIVTFEIPKPKAAYPSNDGVHWNIGIQHCRVLSKYSDRHYNESLNSGLVFNSREDSLELFEALKLAMRKCDVEKT